MAPSSIPPPLPPTVEEAYRRKCVQLKHRTKEVENANDAAHLRLNRMKRQVEKMRLERAFLLEQLARRTSTNVEDSEGSPSPPPTPEPQPKEKPLRTKRGHRKGSLLANIETPPPAGGPSSSSAALGPSGLLNSQNLLRATQSPSSDAFSHSHSHGDLAKSTNGANGKQGKKAPNAFELYCEERRPALLEKAEDDDDEDREGRAANVEEELARGWKNLSEEERGTYQDLADQKREKLTAKKEADAPRSRGDRSSSSAKPAPQEEGDGGGDAEAPGAEDTPAQDEDVEMGNYDSDQETQGEKQDE
ncbi:hypothetical protein BR93DRAFT_975957 [Coniochaeta sp. PMI_546]|nr:hypothetical protein BR93DRAFT_975957 [Coniochaeta sp. PMI_546]